MGQDQENSWRLEMYLTFGKNRLGRPSGRALLWPARRPPLGPNQSQEGSAKAGTCLYEPHPVKPFQLLDPASARPMRVTITRPDLLRRYQTGCAGLV